MIADIPYSKLKVGNTAEISKTISETDVYNFAGICGDFNPLHVDQEFAAKTPFKKRIAHGMLSASLISTLLGTTLPGKNTIYMEQSLKFRAPVFIGDTITARVEVIELITEKNIARLKTEAINQSGDVVIDGQATIMKKT